jgi:hypothetical protein
MSEFNCEGPGVGPLIASLGLGPLPNVFAALVNPWQLHEFDVAFIVPNLVLAVPTLQIAIDAAYVITLPDVPFVTFVLDPMPNIDLQYAANIAMALKLKMLPLNILLAMVPPPEIDIPPVFPDVIFPLLPDIPGIEVLANCITDILEPMFTPLTGDARTAWEEENTPEGEETWSAPSEQTIFTVDDI